LRRPSHPIQRSTHDVDVLLPLPFFSFFLFFFSLFFWGGGSDKGYGFNIKGPTALGGKMQVRARPFVS